MNQARQLWVAFETVHAVTYFAPGCLEANREVGLRGFWMGYFATRSAPLGTPSAVEICDAFFGFRPSIVERAIPDAWTFADPAAVLEARVVSAAEVLRSAIPGLDDQAARIVDSIETVASDSTIEGPLAGPNRRLSARSDVVERLWQACTTLREHRGDIHVAALRSASLSPPEALALFSASGGAPRERLQAARGWSDDEWDEALESLVGRGFVTAAGEITTDGQAVRSTVEEVTDQQAMVPWAAIADEERDRVGVVLHKFASSVAESGLLSYPNPIGLPHPATLEG